MAIKLMAMLPDLTHRQRQEEWMDRPGVDPQELARSLRFIRRINALLGYTRATLGHLERFSRGWKPGQIITLIDLATGSADIPRAILRWGDAKGFDLRIVGIDRHPITTRAAQQEQEPDRPDPRLRLVPADALELPFAAGSFDYALTSMFLHHLDEPAVVQVLREMNRVSRRGVIVADLLRRRRAYAWIRLLTLFSSKMIRHDAAASVAQAFKREEILHLRDQAHLSYATYHPHLAHRFILAGEKGA